MNVASVTRFLDWVTGALDPNLGRDALKSTERAPILTPAHMTQCGPDGGCVVDLSRGVDNCARMDALSMLLRREKEL